MEDLKAGDVVRLKSGGPEMTVNCFITPRSVQCIWFDGAHLQKDLFYSDVLKKK